MRHGTDPRKALMKMAAKYGDVFTIYMGMRRVVVLNGYDVIKEAMVKQGKLFEDRPSQYALDIYSNGCGMLNDKFVCIKTCVHKMFNKFATALVIYSGIKPHQMQYLLKHPWF